MGSDNPSGADDQQERPRCSTWLDRIPSDLGHYIAGFVDGEGSFNVPIRREHDRRLPWRVGLSFNVSQIGPELPSLLRAVFGAGTTRGRGDGVWYFEITKPTDLEARVFPFFERFPLRGPKSADLETFRRVCELVRSREHLTVDGFMRVLELRAGMNRGGKRRRTDRQIRTAFEQRGILRGHTQGSPSEHGDEDMVHAPWRHGDTREL